MCPFTVLDIPLYSSTKVYIKQLGGGGGLGGEGGTLKKKCPLQSWPENL